jgi:hypothetical protein
MITDKNRPALPSERAENEDKVKKHLEDRANRINSMMREDFTKTFQTAHGKRVLAWIAQRAGFGKVILAADSTKKIDPMATTFAAMELNFYTKIREYLPVDVLSQVEYGLVKPAGTLEEKEVIKRKSSKSTKQEK